MLQNKENKRNLPMAEVNEIKIVDEWAYVKFLEPDLFLRYIFESFPKYYSKF